MRIPPPRISGAHIQIKFNLGSLPNIYIRNVIFLVKFSSEASKSGDCFRPHFPRRRGVQGGRNSPPGGVWGEAPEL
jgi:hypothetical protein